MKKLFLMFITVTVIGFVQAQTKRKSVKPATPVTPVKAASKTDNTTKATQTAAPVAVAKPEPKAAPKTNSFQVKGANLLNAGIGVGTYYVGLPFGVSFEHGFSKDISGGIFVDYSSHNYGSYYGGNSKLNIVYAGVRASYHLGEVFKVTNNKFDPYAGASLGYHHISWTYDGSNSVATPYDNSIFFGVHAGARYLFSDHVGAFAEVGYGVAALKLGATFKF
ncbi:hypothetical protein G7092_06950 [Mucilaginibacter sp. HC2]|uniref:hypothetical protein n=1 Tax=Mucilaginibacter inviolabilis TaxID=2714892 RepID=UPI00140DB9F8|nr:hypothetical protein [Mucilaginibacter inviolabilis]NHA03523.1 hypothetical protein [Mucilaginibacter inviolabilis]